MEENKTIDVEQTEETKEVKVYASRETLIDDVIKLCSIPSLSGFEYRASEKVKEIYSNEEVNDVDGVKIDFPDKWVHLRKSNTEPIIRVYSEAATMEEADQLGKNIMNVILSMI